MPTQKSEGVATKRVAIDFVRVARAMVATSSSFKLSHRGAAVTNHAHSKLRQEPQRADPGPLDAARWGNKAWGHRGGWKLPGLTSCPTREVVELM